jgi:ribose 5-phosphate isomerase A
MTHHDVPGDRVDNGIHAAASKALTLIEDGTRVGLGSGRAASVFIGMLGARLRAGLHVGGVPTSGRSAENARKADIPLVALGTELDITVDGADEVAPNLDLVKGWGGAFVRERIVAAASKRQVILVSERKLVARLGEHGRIPVEVIPFAQWIATRELTALGLVPSLRTEHTNGQPFISDNGNLIFDCAPPEPLPDGVAARALERKMLAVTGVVDTGLFLGTVSLVMVGHEDGHVDTLYGAQ